MKTISAETLKGAYAWEWEVEMFREIFGDGSVPLTPENWEKVKPLDRDWMYRLLKGDAKEEYWRVVQGAWDECSRVCDNAEAENVRMSSNDRRLVCLTASDECSRICDAALFEALLKS